MGRITRICSFEKAIILICCFFIVVACELLPQRLSTPVSTAAKTPTSTFHKRSTKTSTYTIVPPTLTPTQQLINFVSSVDAADHVGKVVLVRIENAYCSYRPDVNGAPTFCNDQPFPDHSFTLIAWGKDWTDLDGECIFVEGEVEEYKGKFEIIADSRDQVKFCD